MTLLSSVSNRPRATRQRRHRHIAPIAMGAACTALATALVAFLLWPTWRPDKSGNPGRIPVSVGATLFNVPPYAFRRTVQKHSGPQERVDLSFNYPSLEAPETFKHVSVETFDENMQPIDRIFVSIAAHHDSMSPDARLRTIYPRYFDPARQPAQGGLTQRTFADGSVYAGDDLFAGAAPNLVARCTRDSSAHGALAGMCLSERRIGGADLTFRFPRAWLAQWRDIAGAMDALTAQLGSPRS